MRLMKHAKENFEKDSERRGRALVELYAQPKDMKPEFWEKFKIGKAC